MAYAQSYRSSMGGYRYARSRGSIFSAIGKVAKGVAGAVARVGAGFLGGGPLGLATSTLLPTLGSASPSRGRGAARTPEPGVTGVVHRLVPGGHSGYVGGRRMNYGNAKAARRAIRRIKGVRNLLVSIERQLPRRVVHAKHGKTCR